MALLLIKLSFNLIGYWCGRLCVLTRDGMDALVVMNYACSVAGDHVIPVLALGSR